MTDAEFYSVKIDISLIPMNFNEFQWIFMNDFWSKITKIDPKWFRVTVSRSIHQIFANQMYIKNRPNIPKLRSNKNNATYERFWIRSVFGPFVVRFGGRVICIINDILSNKTTKCLIQTISVMFNRIYSLKFQKNPKF